MIGARTFSLIVPMILGLAACASPSEVRWERAGASDATTFRDASDCSAISWTEAESRHPYTPAQAVGSISVDTDWMRQRQPIDNARFADANRFFAMCMQGRGYARVEMPRR